MLTYPTHFYDPVIPKLGLSARSNYKLSKVDTLGLLSAENKGSMQESIIGPYGDPPPPLLSG